jgi:hypothetical protein
MQHPELETHHWNLSLGVAATSFLAACGPFVVLEGQTDTDTSTQTDTNPRPTEPSETDPTLPGGCEVNGCAPGYECIEDVCVPYGYCDDYGGSGGCCYDCCYEDCYYYECYYDEQCGSQEICNAYNECEYIAPLPECGDVPDIVTLALPDTNESVVGLSFVDANGDAAQDLVMTGVGQAELLLGPGTEPPIPLPVPVGGPIGGAVSGDFDGNGSTELVLTTAEGRLLMLTGDGAGGYVLVLDQFEVGMLSDLVALQWNGDGVLDLAGVDTGLDGSGNAVVLFNSGAGSFTEAVDLPVGEPAYSLGTIDFDGNELDDLVVQDPDSGALFLGDFSGDVTADLYLPGPVHGPRELVSGPITPGAPYEVVGHTSMPGWRLLELWDGAQYGPLTYSLSNVETNIVQMGDIDGDADHDLVLGSSDALTYVRMVDDGGVSGFECHYPYFVGGRIQTMVVGDFDGNGRSDVAIDGATGPAVLLSQ